MRNIVDLKVKLKQYQRIMMAAHQNHIPALSCYIPIYTFFAVQC